MGNVFIDLTPIMNNPLGSEILLALIMFVSIFLTLLLLFKIFNLKKSYKNVFLIAIIIALSSFIVRSMSLIFLLTDTQKPIINRIAMIIEIILLIVLTKKIYNIKWFKSFIISIITYLGKFLVIGILMFIIIFSFTTIPQDIYSQNENFGTFEKVQSKTDFEIVEPSYVPEGYILLNLKSLNNKSIIIHYQHKNRNENYGLSLKETLLDSESELKNYFPLGGEIEINKNKFILSEDPNNLPILTWYSSKLKLLFSLSMGPNGGLNKNELIKIADSIMKNNQV